MYLLFYINKLAQWGCITVAAVLYSAMLLVCVIYLHGHKVLRILNTM
jgi:hypothetical protein